MSTHMGVHVYRTERVSARDHTPDYMQGRGEIDVTVTMTDRDRITRMHHSGDAHGTADYGLQVASLALGRVESLSGEDVRDLQRLADQVSARLRQLGAAGALGERIEQLVSTQEGAS